MNWRAVFSMGGYAVYVWGAYLLTLAAIAAEIGLVRRRRNRLHRLPTDPGKGTNV